MTATYAYETVSIRDISAKQHTHEKTGKKTVESVTINDQPVGTSDRFWNSLYSRYGFGKNMFNYFSPVEVFDRIATVRPDDQVRVCYRTEDNAAMPEMLATSNPAKPVLQHDDVMGLLNQYEPLEGVQYSDGILRASFQPRGEAPFEIGGDEFQARFDCMIPIDAYGSPETVLGALRLVCTNGMVAFGPIFSSKIPGGSDADGGLNRIIQTIESYGNDEGFDAFRRRLDTATKSYASVAECSAMSTAVMRALGADGVKKEGVRDCLEAFDRTAGNPTMMYGLVSTTSVGRKRLATLPSRATVYDLMNFGTEVASHYVANETQARSIFGIVGTMLGNEYDLENSAKDGRDFVDLYLNGTNEGPKSQANAEEATDEDN